MSMPLACGKVRRTSSMNTPLEISFKGLDKSTAIEAKIAEQAARLEKHFDRMNALPGRRIGPAQAFSQGQDLRDQDRHRHPRRRAADRYARVARRAGAGGSQDRVARCVRFRRASSRRSGRQDERVCARGAWTAPAGQDRRSRRLITHRPDSAAGLCRPQPGLRRAVATLSSSWRSHAPHGRKDGEREVFSRGACADQASSCAALAPLPGSCRSRRDR